ncbi:MAG: mechanosensitive ion channel family protein [Promethearchaeota archaeon]
MTFFQADTEPLLDLPLELRILIFFLSIVGIFILQRILQFIITRTVRKTEKVSPDAANGLKVIVRLGAAVLILYAFIFTLEMPPEVSFALSTFLGAAVSFASVQSVQNFIAGFYLLFSRPFEIDDLVKFGNSEGKVVQITLNYTKIQTFDSVFHLIPNRNILSANIVNYSRKVKKQTQEQSSLKSLRTVSNLIYDAKREVIHYSFQYPFPLGDLGDVKEKLEDIFKAYQKKFGYQPKLDLYKIDYAFWFNILIIADQADKIIDNISSFVRDMNVKFY